MTENVLFVDDEQNILSAAKRVFRDDSIAVLTAASATEAMDIVRSNCVAVIISDNMMPGKTGIELLEWAKTASSDSIRILMTGTADLEVAMNAINRGEVFKFITKPWKGDELKRMVFDSIDRYKVISSLKSADEAKLLSLAQAIELKDPYTRGHCVRVASYALRVADALNLAEDMKKGIKHGSWLHDCGKIGVPEAILNKPGPLDAEQIELMKHHPQWGADVAKTALLSPIVVNIVLYHHERYNGRGYPSGLKGVEIPLEARVVALADFYDALTSDRPYRKGLSHESTIEEIKRERSESFDPSLTDLFVFTLEKGVLGESQ